ncbi:MAG: glycosyltransferase family 4 protein [Sulfuricella sp.]
MAGICYQINLQQGMGGGEVYTRFFTRALCELGWEVVLFVHERAHFWHGAEIPGARYIPVRRYEDITALLPEAPSLFVTHSPTLGALGERLRQRHFLVSFAHMPLYGRNPAPFQEVDLIFAVSSHVITSLQAAGLNHYYPQPLYGVADLDRGGDDNTPIPAASSYDWDTRKLRDRLLGMIEPLYRRFRPAQAFSRKPGLTLGIVSRLTPIKQFPLMFEILAPVIRQFPLVNLEIFGSGGYASVRDLKRALAPIRDQTRFWGQQSNVGAIYRQLDFLLTGLPEKEALGLNIIEAEHCGTPVLAIHSPPFTETVTEGETGLFYIDPRQDQGRDFARLLGELTAGRSRPKSQPDNPHLAKFSFPEFKQRVASAMNFAAQAAQIKRQRGIECRTP